MIKSYGLAIAFTIYVKIQSPILIVCIWVGVVCGYTVYRGRVDVCTSGGTVGVQQTKHGAVRIIRSFLYSFEPIISP